MGGAFGGRERSLLRRLDQPRRSLFGDVERAGKRLVADDERVANFGDFAIERRALRADNPRFRIEVDRNRLGFSTAVRFEGQLTGDVFLDDVARRIFDHELGLAVLRQVPMKRRRRVLFGKRRALVHHLGGGRRVTSAEPKARKPN